MQSCHFNANKKLQEWQLTKWESSTHRFSPNTLQSLRAPNQQSICNSYRSAQNSETAWRKIHYLSVQGLMIFSLHTLTLHKWPKWQGSRMSPLRHQLLSPTHRNTADKAAAKAPVQDLSAEQQPQQSSPGGLDSPWCSIPSVPACPEQHCYPGTQDRATRNPEAARQISMSCVHIRKSSMNMGLNQHMKMYFCISTPPLWLMYR